jgi:hypothetical protein
MNHMTVNTPDAPWNEPDQRSYEPQPDLGECVSCGSYNTFTTKDNVLVCRHCWTVFDLKTEEVIKESNNFIYR